MPIGPRRIGAASTGAVKRKTRGEKDMECIEKNRVVVHGYHNNKGKKIKRQCRAKPGQGGASMKQLRAQARQIGLPRGYSKLSKAALQAAIQDHGF